MRSFFLFLIAVIFIGGGLYYESGKKSETASSTATSTPEVSFFDRVLSFIPGKEEEMAIDDDEMTEKKEESEDTNEAQTKTTDSISQPTSRQTAPTVATPSLTDKIENLQENVDSYIANQAVATYEDMVTIAAASAAQTIADQEYITLTAKSDNVGPVTISGWRIESAITNRGATIPNGSRFLVSAVDRTTAPITLNPGEKAYVMTGTTPLRVSFRENECSGYLKEEGAFVPALTEQCPLPSDELLLYGGTQASNGDCSTYVSTIPKCKDVTEMDVSNADVSGSCEKFVEDVLSYKGCAERHQSDSTYFSPGAWRIYLNNKSELWRSAKETIRLLDQNGRVVDTLEY